jgi:glycerol-3-phosphate dehydrogenase (NAD+)
MWVFEEDIDGHNLTSLINERHQNQKYLPGHTLPGNLVADPDIVSAVANATILIFVVPSPFLNAAVRDLHGHVRQDAIAVSLIKGAHFATHEQLWLLIEIQECVSMTVVSQN